MSLLVSFGLFFGIIFFISGFLDISLALWFGYSGRARETYDMMPNSPTMQNLRFLLGAGPFGYICVLGNLSSIESPFRNYMVKKGLCSLEDIESLPRARRRFLRFSFINGCVCMSCLILSSVAMYMDKYGVL